MSPTRITGCPKNKPIKATLGNSSLDACPACAQWLEITEKSRILPHGERSELRLPLRSILTENVREFIKVTSEAKLRIEMRLFCSFQTLCIADWQTSEALDKT